MHSQHSGVTVGVSFPPATFMSLMPFLVYFTKAVSRAFLIKYYMIKYYMFEEHMENLQKQWKYNLLVYLGH